MQVTLPLGLHRLKASPVVSFQGSRVRTRVTAGALHIPGSAQASVLGWRWSSLVAGNNLLSDLHGCPQARR